MAARHIRGWLTSLALASALLAGLAAAVDAGRSTAGTAAPPSPAAAQALVDGLRSRVGSPGLSAAVTVRGRLAWSQGSGEADIENHVPAGAQTLYRVGSLSKLLTVAAAVRLLEEGRLDLDAPVQRYVPGFPDQGHTITARQLAGHLAGIRHYAAKDFTRPPRRYARLADGLELFQDDPLLHPPGTRYLYSSYGYNLLGLLVEAAAGKEFLATVQELVLQPLGLTRTVADDPERIIEGRSGFYRRDAEGVLHNERAIDSSYKWPSGGFLSSAEDMVRFAAAHLRDGFLRPETRRLLFTSQRTAAGAETGVGLGWRIGRDAAGRRFLHHGGAIEGGRAFLLVYPGEEVAVALLSNLSGARFAESEAQELAALWFRPRGSEARATLP